nr:immunoglobulin light chain junction region [Macaca mulatta]MOV75214.1 immunoglobulin light chain junction region [Macaca mulatta]MOV76015.1 immunoglobulin light chain junction region [Macaca mulatta]MOW09976.1 immunoglobulin light chain junction region [Macaca mulatta]MOW11564.1 immunoglobulin light chain junction region [Macaca mulatta]
CMQGIQLPFTF